MADLIVFPEMTLTGFYTNLVEEPKKVDYYINKLSLFCKEKQTGLIVGHPEKKEESIYNAASIILPGKDIVKYRKIHLTEEESKYFTPGNENKIFSFKKRKVGIIICKDQNFPKQIMDLKKCGIDILLILAGHYYAPGEARRKLEKNQALPIVRALENKIYVIKANTIGNLFDKISLGHSMIVNPEGIVVNRADELSELNLIYEISDIDKTSDRCLL